jgi:hypothetical protein
VSNIAGGKTPDVDDESRDTPDTWALRRDEVRAAAMTVVSAYQTAHRAAGAIQRTFLELDRVLALAEEEVRPTASMCQACGAPESQLKSGYCPKHFNQWRDSGYPDRMAFESTVPPWSPTTPEEG